MVGDYCPAANNQHASSACILSLKALAGYPKTKFLSNAGEPDHANPPFSLSSLETNHFIWQAFHRQHSLQSCMCAYHRRTGFQQGLAEFQEAHACHARSKDKCSDGGKLGCLTAGARRCTCLSQRRRSPLGRTGRAACCSSTSFSTSARMAGPSRATKARSCSGTPFHTICRSLCAQAGAWKDLSLDLDPLCHQHLGSG